MIYMVNLATKVYFETNGPHWRPLIFISLCCRNPIPFPPLFSEKMKFEVHRNIILPVV
jgi:hypothetical protein